MPRPIPQHGEPVNGDSFLDIVASVVSIMIIMVVMVGMRIKNAPVTVAIPSNPAMTELEKDVATEQIASGRRASRLGERDAPVAARGRPPRPATRRAGHDGHGRGARRFKSVGKKLDAAKQADFDLARGLSEAKFQLDQLDRQRERGGRGRRGAGRRRELSHADQPRGGRARGASADFQRPRPVRAVAGAVGGIPIASEAASLQAGRPAGVDRHGRADRRLSGFATRWSVTTFRPRRCG